MALTAIQSQDTIHPPPKKKKQKTSQCFIPLFQILTTIPTFQYLAAFGCSLVLQAIILCLYCSPPNVICGRGVPMEATQP